GKGKKRGGREGGGWKGERGGRRGRGGESFRTGRRRRSALVGAGVQPRPDLQTPEELEEIPRMEPPRHGSGRAESSGVVEYGHRRHGARTLEPRPLGVARLRHRGGRRRGACPTTPRL